MKGLFVPPKADASNLYRQIWSENKGDSKDIRMLMHPIWREFEAYSDKKFVGEIQKNFDGCFWEMYLTVLMIRDGLAVDSKDYGPDIKLEEEGAVVWIEAISPTNGQNLPEKFTEEFLISRITAALKEKKDKYLAYIEDGTIKTDEPYVIAVNISQIGDFPSRNKRLMLKSIFPIDSEVLKVNKRTGAYDVTFDYRDLVRNHRGAPINTDQFLSEDYVGVSGVIFSMKDVVNLPAERGSEIVFYRNPKALNPVEIKPWSFGDDYAGYMNGEILIYSKK